MCTYQFHSMTIVNAGEIELVLKKENITNDIEAFEEIEFAFKNSNLIFKVGETLLTIKILDRDN